MSSLIAIKVPSSLTPETVLPFSDTLYSLDNANEYIFDLENVKYVEPFGMLYLVAVLRQFKKHKELTADGPMGFKAVNFRGNSYASYMGFYRAFGLKYGNEPGEAPGSSNYIPLTRLKTEPMKRKARTYMKNVGELVEREAGRIANVLTRSESGELFDTLTYSVRELFRNVFEHSGAESIWYAGQYWPSKHIVEIAILDEGVGVRKSLTNNPKIEIRSPEEALYLAIQPGVTGTQKKYQRRVESSWRNSGYGLYMTSSLCSRGGHFTLCSENRSLSLDDSGLKFSQCQFAGTALRMVLDTRLVKHLQTALDEIRKRGEELATTQGYGGRITASMISRMLARDLTG